MSAILDIYRRHFSDFEWEGKKKNVGGAGGGWKERDLPAEGGFWRERDFFGILGNCRLASIYHLPPIGMPSLSKFPSRTHSFWQNLPLPPSSSHVSARLTRDLSVTSSRTLIREFQTLSSSGGHEECHTHSNVR